MRQWDSDCYCDSPTRIGRHDISIPKYVKFHNADAGSPDPDRDEGVVTYSESWIDKTSICVKHSETGRH